jgi:hypothetical protein
MTISKKKNQKIASIDNDMGKREPLYIVGENVNFYSHYGRQCGSSLKKMELLFDPATPLLGTYSRKIKIIFSKS